MENDVQQAIEAEKAFHDRNLLLVSFIEEPVNPSTFKQLHECVHEVHLLQSEFSPKCRYIIEVKGVFDIHAVKDVIKKHNFENRQVHVELLEKFNDSNVNLDPYKLQVNNLPSSISSRELKQLFPLSTDYTFLLSELKSRSVLVHFSKVQDSITTYKTTNFMQYQSNILTVKFYRKDLYKTTQHKISFTEDRDMDSCESSDDDITRWKDIQMNALKDKKVSDTLLVHNLPLNTTVYEIQELFPNLHGYKFIPEYRTKSCIVRFKKIEDAVNMYKESDNIFKSNILKIDFYDKENDSRFSETSMVKHENEFCSIEEESNEDEDQNNSRNEQNEERIDRFVLHVENLPQSTNNEDILHLFPDHFRHEIISIKNQNSVSAHVSFKTAEETLKAYNASKNILYKRKILSVKLKSKKFKKLNPFALMKRSTAYPTENNSKKQQKLDVPKMNHDEIIIIDDAPTSEIQNEDDVEYIPEEDNYIQGNFFGAQVRNGDCFLDDDNNLNNDYHFKGVESDLNTLPLDEDDF